MNTMDVRKELTALGMKDRELDQAIATAQAINHHSEMTIHDATVLTGWVWARGRVLAEDIYRLQFACLPARKFNIDDVKSGRMSFADFVETIAATCEEMGARED